VGRNFRTGNKKENRMQNKEDYRKYKKIYYQNKFNIILYEVMKKESYNQYNEAA